MDWTAGYVADIDYNSQYYTELNPVRLSLALLNAGYALPKFRTACELGAYSDGSRPPTPI